MLIVSLIIYHNINQENMVRRPIHMLQDARHVDAVSLMEKRAEPRRGEEQNPTRPVALQIWGSARALGTAQEKGP